jgi:hypothetical protein
MCANVSYVPSQNEECVSLQDCTLEYYKIAYTVYLYFRPEYSQL